MWIIAALCLSSKRNPKETKEKIHEKLETVFTRPRSCGCGLTFPAVAWIGAGLGYCVDRPRARARGASWFLFSGADRTDTNAQLHSRAFWHEPLRNRRL